MTDPIASVLWRNLIEPGMEYCRLAESGSGLQLTGQVVGLTRGTPFHVHYQIECNLRWHTRSVNFGMYMGAQSTDIHITVDEQWGWWRNGREVENVRGCEFVDLGVSPSTNTLPVRAFDLPLGTSREFVAAWIRFPDLSMLPLRQRYTHLADALYRYESLVDGKINFTAELRLDEHGLVIDYEGVWKREPAGEIR